ncbi:5'-nucleotidase YfbR [Oceanimonas sp. GK1]|uniref:5'-deoxynucleotidase n=1 Tax=Oceanimonas sp. (strain GK1 / IBRC-M 10197) TaxID=511062 RepID=UPI000249505B|nr:5'-deoxynucleotidase [Oceanimonas sp. GK1]AEY02224.1 5'-nucleotidase YfbR [Oceanimonas sp. GK1]
MNRSHFYAQMARMKLIQRWPLMRNTDPENVAEHSLQVAMVAHALAVIKNTLFGGRLDPGMAALRALYHDASEVLTGDLPTPVKYFNHDIATAYKAIEQNAEQSLLAMLPAELQPAFAPLLCGHRDDDYSHLVKSADMLCAYLKCEEELSAGNREFAKARERLTAMLDARMNDEIQYFLEVFVPSFSLSLDEISTPGF